MAEAEYEIDGEWFNDHEMLRLAEYVEAPRALGRPVGELIRANERTDIRLALQGCIVIYTASKIKLYTATEKGREHLEIWSEQYKLRQAQDLRPWVDTNPIVARMQEEIDRLTAERAERDETIRKQRELIAQMVDTFGTIRKLAATESVCSPIIENAIMQKDRTDDAG